MGKFIITSKSAGEYVFLLKGDNGQTLLTSDGFKTKNACRIGIDAIKANALDETKYGYEVSEMGKCYFVLKAFQGQVVIGKSEMFETSTGRDTCLKFVKSNALNAPVEED